MNTEQAKNKKIVKFGVATISEFEKNEEIDEIEAGNDTDYEEENEDPVELLKKLVKDRSFGNEEYGQDYESNAELRRQVEITFNSIKNPDSKFYIPDFNPEIRKDPFIKEELNDIPKILGKEKEKDSQHCSKCNELMSVNYNPCNVCFRETVDVRCINCFPNILELCSNKCREIYEGVISVIRITNDDDEPIIVIEDDGQNMVLQVINHKLFYQELNEKDKLMLNKPCMNCNEGEEEVDGDGEEDEEGDELDDINIGRNERKKKIGVIPIKCHTCQANYSYLVVCGTCYQKSGLNYLCDECEI